MDLFSMMSVTCAIEPLRVANRLLGYEAYRWRFASEDGQVAHASNGFSVVADERFGASPAPNYLFVCAGMTLVAKDQTRLSVILNRRAREGCRVGALSMGPILLARAGLLTNARCTLHWEGQPAFREEFPFIELSNEIYVIDNNRYTCAGGTAALDMILHIISEQHGAVLARSIANQFQVQRIRTGAVEQRPGSSVGLDTLPAQLAQALGIMMRNLEKPVGIDSIARTCGMSIRNLERLFQRHADSSPARYYKILRLEHARDLLLHTNLAHIDIGIATGFCSSSYFSASYTRHFGHTPSQERIRNL
ncbi:ThiJ/PfpI domain-containing protein [Mesorhizobium plurifarium]|uniref:ThiJ/PfpI domain-containing protein n=1 Tax=Mesorhizobium plurifarium TaxID=69974 RepID=A0A090ENM5_MESPL|nr:ThiJ/PfpI domain-containing protein [Mesorhizobium plurifarium]